MKKLLILLVITGATTFAFGQSKTIEDFRDQYKDDRDAKSISLSGGLFELIGSIAGLEETDEDAQTIARIAEGIQSMDILVIPMYVSGFDKQSLEEMRKELKKEKYEELMSVNEGNERIYFMAQEGSGSQIRNMLVLVREEDEFIVMDITGSLDMRDLAYLARNHNDWD